MKDESRGLPTQSFVGLKAKQYTYITEDKHERKKAIGINNSVLVTTITMI